MATLTPAPRLDVNPILGPEREALLDLLGALDDAEWQQATECPAWSVKGVALHVLGDDLSLLSRQRDAATPGVLLFAQDHPGTDFRGLLDGFNEQWVAAARFMSEPLLVELLRLTGVWTSELYGSVDLDATNEPVGFFNAKGPSPYWQIAAREYVERWVHHSQIRRALGRPPLGSEYLEPAAATVVRGVAAHLPDLGAASGTALALTIPAIGGWTVVRDGEGWELFYGAAEDAAATVAVDPGVATAVLSRGLSREHVAAALTATGDPALAAQAVAFLVLMTAVDGRS